MSDSATIYRYGPIAWVWRGLIGMAFFASGLLLFAGVRLDTLQFTPIVLILAAPAVYFGLAVATRVDRLSDSQVKVWTLIFWRRHIPCEEFGTPRMRSVYQGKAGPIQAPAAWVPVRRGVPVFLDLLGQIPDRPLLDAAFGLPGMTPSRPAKPSRK